MIAGGTGMSAALLTGRPVIVGHNQVSQASRSVFGRTGFVVTFHIGIIAF